MPLTHHDERLLARALHLAREALGLASPNPTVGCVLAHGETILGEGAHHYDERDHAEIVALKQAASLGHNVHGATAYVTLEPCAHHGRTGPCADALAAAGISRCVVTTVDPNPLVRGQGLEKLHSAGVEIDLADPASEIAQSARRLNDAFAFSILNVRPFVTLKAALSVDGKLAPPDSARTALSVDGKPAPHWITGSASRADAQSLRHGNDAILTGIGTVLADNPSLTDRTGLARRRPLLRVVLDTELRTPLDSTLVTTAANDLLLVCATGAQAEREAALTARGAEVLRLPALEGRLDLAVLFAALSKRRILSVLVEAGSALNGSLLRADLVDALVLYYAEQELGLDGLPFAIGFTSPYDLQQSLTSVTRATFPHGEGEDVRIAGYLHDPWTEVA
jgi:diaminohydroxyphosphoribosylaminopyrimidine deaminase/5-amino-6-(5-phosphoribosylamino)uracil reductase